MLSSGARSRGALARRLGRVLPVGRRWRRCRRPARRGSSLGASPRRPRWRLWGCLLSLARCSRAEGERRHWRTRKDPFEAVWPRVLLWLQDEPERTGIERLLPLQTDHPGEFHDGQLQTLQRRLKAWRRAVARKLVFTGNSSALLTAGSSRNAPSTSRPLSSRRSTSAARGAEFTPRHG